MARFIDPLTDTSFKIIFNRLANVGNPTTLDPEERLRYEYDLKKARDYHAVFSFTGKIALEEGREEDQTAVFMIV